MEVTSLGKIYHLMFKMHEFQQVLTWFVWRLLCRYIAFEAYWSKNIEIKHTLKVIMLFMQAPICTNKFTKIAKFK
jgi:hypothetical protein